MNGYLAFTKKELMEQLRTYKTFILLAVFFLFGMTSPLLAKLMPQIFSNIDMGGVQITLPEPTYMDAYAQFFKNVTQMGMIAVILVFSGMISSELNKDTLVNMLSKGLSRNSVILSKYTAALALWTAALCASSVTNYIYTVYLFGNNSVLNLVFSFFCLWLFGAFLLALMIFTGTLTKGNYSGLLLTALILGVMMVMNSFTAVKKFSPLNLVTQNMNLISGMASPHEMQLSLMITIAFIFFSIALSVIVFRSKRI